MKLLLPNEYDASFFDGKFSATPHPSGYFETEFNDYWQKESQRYIDLIAPLEYRNKVILDIGCAKGFVTEVLCDEGADAFGFDVSVYAIETAIDSAKNRRPDLASRFVVGDMRTDLGQYADNQFDIVLSYRTLECVSDEDILATIVQMNRIGKAQVHIIDEDENTDFWNIHPLQWWANLPFASGTRVVAYASGQSITI